MDAIERQQALNCQQSFIVQAPAGSGKTELLTQRYLALLAKVPDPQAILALTFTKKAAQEMRHRILQALQDAAHDIPLKNQHQTTTRMLAKQALNQDQTLDWNILSKPQQLRITTFDAFCLELYQTLPQMDAAKIPKISNFPEQCYQQAIHQWFDWCREMPDLQPLLKRMLAQMDFKPSKLFGYLQELLKTRDQWLFPLNQQAQMSHIEIERLFFDLVSPYFHSLASSLPPHVQADLMAISQKVAEIRPDLYPHLQSFDLHTPSPQLLQELSQLLCTSTHEWRKEFNHHVGLKADYCSSDTLKALKKASQELLLTLHDYEEFKHLLIHLAQFPEPNTPEMNHALLQAYYRLLPLLVAHLHLEFARLETCDFIYIAQLALMALQESDLKLHFEQQLHHLLVDEFQDTSELQHELLKQLTLDFEQEPEKTVFMVGDPMQSIYRFRAAKVGIFLQVQQYGLGELSLQNIQLKQNFRSAPQLIRPLNALFQTLFPVKEAIELGAVGFHAAHPALPEHPNAALLALYCINSAAQGQKIIEIIQLALVEGAKSIAILVRSRQQMQTIMQALEHAKLPYQGLDLIPIREHWIIRDLFNLCKLLLKPGHRQHELAVMRSPLVGLDLAALHQLSRLCPQSICDWIANENNCKQLPETTQARLRHFSHLFGKAKQQQWRLPFHQVLTNLCLDLQVNLIYSQPEHQRLIERFFSIIEQTTTSQAWPDIKLINDYLEHSYWSCHQPFHLQLMTMHKSKGLEFDWVIIPNLGDGPKPVSHQPLMWMTTKAQSLMMVHDREQSPNSYFYRFREQEQERYEALRLAYVAFTRAKVRLYLLDDKIKAEKSSFRALLAEDFFKPADVAVPSPLPSPESAHQRLPLLIFQSKSMALNQTNFISNPAFEDQYVAKNIGIITHKMVQWIGQHHPHSLAQVPWKLAENLLFHARLPLQWLGRIQQSIETFWQCPIGQWICAPHPHEANELALLIKDGEIMRQAILDRTFVDEGRRWIIDFKTGQKEDGSHLGYQTQVNRYGAYMQALQPNVPVFCGLYYLHNQTWDTWPLPHPSLEENLFDVDHTH